MDTTDYYLMGGDEDGDEDENEDELEEANTSLPSVVATDKSKNRGRITDFALIC
jgi:electron transfer flavoprotein alpha/beta subunit